MYASTRFLFSVEFNPAQWPWFLLGTTMPFTITPPHLHSWIYNDRTLPLDCTEVFAVVVITEKIEIAIDEWYPLLFYKSYYREMFASIVKQFIIITHGGNGLSGHVVNGGNIAMHSIAAAFIKFYWLIEAWDKMLTIFSINTTI